MASEKKDPTPSLEPDVLDAEIVEDIESGTAAFSAAPASQEKTVEQVSSKTSGKSGWMVSAVLAAFIGGLVAAPHGEQGLRTLGLLPPLPPVAPSGEDTQGAQARAQLSARLDDLNNSIVLHQEILAQQATQLEAAAAARQQLNNDIALIAGQPGGVVSDENAATLRNIEARVQAATDEIARLAALSTAGNPEVAGLTGALALARAESAQLVTRLGTLEQIVARLQAGVLDVSPRGRLLVALGRLKDQIARGLPLAGELDVLRVDMAELPALDQQLLGADLAVLANHQDGVATYETLVRDFGTVASAAKRAQEKSEGSFLASLFTVRRTDDGATGIDAILLSAERRLAARDVKGAAEELNRLTGEAATATQAWRSAAMAHAAVVQAVNQLQRAVASSSPGGDR